MKRPSKAMLRIGLIFSLAGALAALAGCAVGMGIDPNFNTPLLLCTILLWANLIWQVWAFRRFRQEGNGGG